MKPLSPYQKQAISWMEKEGGWAWRNGSTNWRPGEDTTRMISHCTMKSLVDKGLAKWDMTRLFRRQDLWKEAPIRAVLVNGRAGSDSPTQSE